MGDYEELEPPPRGSKPVHLVPFRYDHRSAAWQPGEPGAGDPAPAGRLRVATFNVWFSDHCFAERRDAMFELLPDLDADVIALQEVRPDFLEELLEQRWVRDGYHVSHVDGRLLGAYGVVLLTHACPVQLVAHHIRAYPSRPLLAADFAGSLRVGTVHLASMRHNAAVRAVQLGEIFPLMHGPELAVLVGDFNFCARWPENRNLHEAWVDVWPALRPDDPGWTEDTEVNAMRRAFTGSDKQVRFDRVLFRCDSGAWRPETIELLGIRPIAPESPEVFPSDHFGLVASLVR